jgi:hypothetical protein
MQFVRQPAFVLGKHLPKWLDGELYAGGGMWGGASFPLPWCLVSFYNIFAVGAWEDIASTVLLLGIMLSDAFQTAVAEPPSKERGPFLFQEATWLWRGLEGGTGTVATRHQSVPINPLPAIQYCTALHETVLTVHGLGSKTLYKYSTVGTWTCGQYNTVIAAKYTQ